MDDAIYVAADDLCCAAGKQHLGHGSTGGTRADDCDFDVGELFVDDAECVAKRSEDRDRRAVLVVVKHRNVQSLLEATLDLEATGRGDVLEVDAAEGRSECLYARHDLVRIRRVETDRPRVDTCKLLEEHCLAFHHRHRGLWTDVAEAEDGRTIGDDRNRVALRGQVPDHFGLVDDCLTDTGNARRVGHREIVAGANRYLRRHLNLAALVHQKGAVRDVDNTNPIDRTDRIHDPIAVILVRTEDADVTHNGAGIDAYEIDCAEHGVRFANHGSHARELPRLVWNHSTDGQAVGGRVVSSHRSQRSAVVVRLVSLYAEESLRTGSQRWACEGESPLSRRWQLFGVSRLLRSARRFCDERGLSDRRAVRLRQHDAQVVAGLYAERCDRLLG